ALIDLALVDRAVAEIAHAHLAIAAVLVGEAEAGAEWDLAADDAVAPVKALLALKHVHRAALALGIATTPPGQLGHHALGVHAAGQHVAVVAVGGDDGVALFGGGLHTPHHGLLADIEVAEAADQAHAVELGRAVHEP